MGAIIAGLLAFIPEVPGIVSSIEKLIARGQKSGELTGAEADVLTASAVALFAKYDKPAPPPPGVTAGEGS